MSFEQFLSLQPHLLSHKRLIIFVIINETEGNTEENEEKEDDIVRLFNHILLLQWSLEWRKRKIHICDQRKKRTVSPSLSLTASAVNVTAGLTNQVKEGILDRNQRRTHMTSLKKWGKRDDHHHLILPWSSWREGGAGGDEGRLTSTAYEESIGCPEFCSLSLFSDFLSLQLQRRERLLCNQIKGR